jgi:CheY-like chemotaxis protein/putative methionine-R-sulfoxide reductase with GAF domain
MQNVLVVDDEKTLLMIMTGRFEDYKDRFNVFTAGNGKEAVKVLESKEIDLVVTDLKMPEMDGIELIAYMSNKFPAVPTIAVSAYCTPEIQNKLKGLGALRVMDKPVNLDLLAESVLSGLDQASKGGSLSCVSLSSFLQIIEMEEKSCRIDVHANGQQRGSFFLVRGELYDAACGELAGEQAAHEMIGWEKTHLYIKDLPPQTPERRIEKGLMSVVMEGLRKKDEARTEEQGNETAEEETPIELDQPVDQGQDNPPPARSSNVKVIKADPDDPGPIFGPEDDTFTSELDSVLDVLKEESAVAELEETEPPPGSPADQQPEPPVDKQPEPPADQHPELQPELPPEPQPEVDSDGLLQPAEIVEAARTSDSCAEVVAALIQKAGAVLPVDVAILLAPVEGRTDGLRISNLIYSDQRIVDTSTVMPLSNTLVARAMERQAPAALELADLKPGSVEKKLLDRLKMKSCMLVPLESDGSSPTMLILAAAKEGQFSGGGVQLEWVTGGLALALERRQLQNGLSSHRQAAETVQQIGKASLSGDLEIEPLLKMAIDRIRTTLQVEAGSVFLKEKDQLKVAVAFNTIIGSVKRFQLKIGQGIAGTVAAKAKPMIVNDAQKSSLLFREIDEQTGFTTRSVLCVPMIAFKKVIGVIEVLNKSGQGFTGDDENLLLSIASTLSTAMMFKRSQSGR